jgi:two-component system, LytTR family, sensor kinase
MNRLTTTYPNLRSMESRLIRTTDPYQRLELLDKLVGAYAFIDFRKARKFLDEQGDLLKIHDYPDFQLAFHLNHGSIENQLYNYNLAEIHFQKAIELLDERGDTKQQIEGYIDYAGTCMNRKELEKATGFLDRAAKSLKNFPDPQLEAWHTCREGFLHLKYVNYPKATELLLEADKKIRNLQKVELKDYYFRTLILSALGRIYERTDEVNKSIKSFEEAVEICEKLQMKTRLSWHYLNAGQAYMRKGRDDKAQEYFRKAIKIKDDISQNSRAGAYANLGSCYFRDGKFDEALKLYKRAEQIYSNNADPNFSNFSIVEMKKAQLYAATDKDKRAEKHYASAIKFAEKQKDYKQLSKVCEEVAGFHAGKGKFQLAFNYLKLHNRFKEEHLEETKQQQLMELEFKYEAEKKKQEAELLKLQAIGLQLKALRSQMNPHFMYNALNSIQKYITSNELNDASKYLAKFAHLMRQSLEYSDIEVISLEKEIEFLENYLLISQKLRFGDRMTYQIAVDEDIEEDIMGVPTMIIQPFVENSIEHGLRQKKNGLIKVDFKLHDDNTILCVVEDNGIGREAVKKLQELDDYHVNHQSKGTSITEERLEILNKSKNKGVFVKTIDLIDSITLKASGTRVEILIPIDIIQKK